MSDEANTSPAKNNVDTPEVSSQTDGTKVLLTNNDVVKVEEAKFKKGDTEIDVGMPPKSFSGLTKEELMKYSTDPFWIKLRMFLFVLFWLVWLTMLVVAIVLIIKAPSCAPPPERLLIEEQAMVFVDPDKLPTPEELIAKMESLNILSAYFPALISERNFEDSLYDAEELIKNISTAGKTVVVDLPLAMADTNPLYESAFEDELIHSDGTWNFNTGNLTSGIQEYLLNYWIEIGVSGFLFADADEFAGTNRTEFKTKLNEILKEKDVGVGSNLIDFKKVEDKFRPFKFDDFLRENAELWSFYKFNAGIPMQGNMNAHESRLSTIGLFLFGGTPILTDYSSLGVGTEGRIQMLSDMREYKVMKLGLVTVANTTENVVAFTRTYKGTPAYAIALNFKGEDETISFAGTPHLTSEGHSGTIEIDSRENSTVSGAGGKVELTNVKLAPYQGLVIQFVGKF